MKGFNVMNPKKDKGKNVKNDPDLLPNEDDYWNSNISNISTLDNVIVASCVSVATDFRNVNLVLFISPGTTIQEIIDDWWQIKAIRDNISNVFGYLPNSELSFHQAVYRLHEEFNMSYKEIAEFLNYEILIPLCVGIQFVLSENEPLPDSFFRNFEECLISFGVSSDAVNDWAKLAKINLSNDKFPWTPEAGPITRSMVREKVRQFRSKVKEDGLQIDINADKTRYFADWVGYHQRKALSRLWNKTYGDQVSYKRKFRKWYEIREKLFFHSAGINIGNRQTPPDVGKIKKFFP